jgi:rhamnose transport system substrate-binding protein
MKTRLILAFATALMALLLFGCAKKDAPQDVKGAAKKTTIGLMPKKKGEPYFTSCSQGAAEAAKELGNVELVYDGPTDGTAEKQAAMIEQWMLKGMDVIAVSPSDPEVLAATLTKAREKGVRVITWDADCVPASREFFINQATAQAIGYALVDNMVKDLGSAEGEVAIITASLTDANQNAWIAAMKERLPTYPKLKLVAIKPSEADQKLAFQVAQDFMKAYPALKGIFAISSMAFPGAAEAVRQADKKGKVLVIGLSTPKRMADFVKDGTVKSVVLWNTADLGYLTVMAASQLLNGTLKPGAVSLTAGRLGEKKVAGDNVLLGDIMVFNKDNIDKFDF